MGVESFYALPEEIASKGLADYLMLRRKLPDEIFDGRRTLPSSLFRRDDVASYLVNLDHALEQAVAEFGPEGTVDLFDLTRRLGHRMGLASWAGPGSAQGDTFDRLVAAFDTLVGSDAFVHPDAMAAVAASDKRDERAALDDVVERYRVPAGWTIATLLPLLNTSAATGLERWDPDRWHRHRLADASALPSPMLVTAFGHGRHSCPAQPFSLAAITAAMNYLLGRYAMTPQWTSHPSPVPAQIGGVARAAEPCAIRYCATR